MDHANRRFRIAALVMIGVLVAPEALNLFVAPAPPGHKTPAAVLELGLVIAALAGGLGFAFWKMTGLRPGHAPRWAPALLVLQAILLFVLTADLAPLVTVEIGYVFPSKQAWRWYAVLLLLMSLQIVIVLRYGTFEPATGLRNLPLWGQAVATWLELAGWTFVAFVAGRFLASERERRYEYERLNGELLAAREVLAHTSRIDERLRIARDLHDTLGHHLTALALNLDLAGRTDGPMSVEATKRAHLVSKLLLNDVRETVAVMREETSIDIAESLNALARNLPAVTVHVEVDPKVHLNTVQAHAVLRAVQEALTNAVRHGGARQIWITLEAGAGDTTIELTVRDDGNFSGTPIEPGNGLHGMQERLAALGGTLDYQQPREPPGQGRGFQIRVSLPSPGSELT